MKNNINGASIVNDFLRRKIEADKIEPVSQGLLLMWLLNNSYVCELRINAENTNRQPAEVSIKDGEYINTYTPQEIADDMEKTAMEGSKYQ